MTNENSIIKKIMALIFVVVIFAGFVRSNSYGTLESISEYLGQNDFTGEESISVSSLESDFSDGVYNKKSLINLNGLMAKILSMQGFYREKRIYVTDEKYIVSPYNYTSTDYEYVETVLFKDFLNQNGVKFLYVNEPAKYIDDSLFAREFGIESYSNRNADLFLERIKNDGVNVIDLRDNIKEENLNIYDMFYRTDHHWTAPAGLWATRIMAEGLNDFCNYDIDTSVYDEKNYTTTEWKKCWLGEQGRVISKAYVGLDDYTEVKPNFQTSFTFKDGDYSWDGTFDTFIDEGVYNTENDVYENTSWHYSYSRINCINNNVENGKVLILGDSYDHVVQPFLALGVHEVDSLILREFDDDFSLKNYILDNGYDTVIVAYAQFMVGAHDNESSANYRMFKFDY